MPIECSICSRGTEAANIVNEMLWAKRTLDQISKATKFHRSSINRHQHGACIFSFPKYKASRVASKNKPLDQHSRLIVCWPANVPGYAPGTHPKFTLFGGGEITRDQLNANDTLLVVRYERPLLTEMLVDEAIAENAERNLADAFVLDEDSISQ